MNQVLIKNLKYSLLTSLKSKTILNTVHYSHNAVENSSSGVYRGSRTYLLPTDPFLSHRHVNNVGYNPIPAQDHQFKSLNRNGTPLFSSLPAQLALVVVVSSYNSIPSVCGFIQQTLAQKLASSTRQIHFEG